MTVQTGTPRYFPTIAADKTCGVAAAHAILAALFQRERTGRGQFIEIPMFETMTSYVLVEHLYGHHLPGHSDEIGYPRVLTEWRKPYQTLDGYVCMMPYTDKHWQTFFKESGHPQYAVDERFTKISARTKYIAELYELAGQIVSKHPTAFWLDFCDTNEIPAAAANRLQDLESDPHLKSVGFFTDIQNDQGHQYRFIRSPVRMEHSSVEPAMAPRLGEHTRAELLGAGLSAEHIDQMLARGAAKQHAGAK
jgi:crotonobetainyl-CoA:carnitine CoA-transferase CaiB-like acyl-CoA transferase